MRIATSFLKSPTLSEARHGTFVAVPRRSLIFTTIIGPLGGSGFVLVGLAGLLMDVVEVEGVVVCAVLACLREYAADAEAPNLAAMSSSGSGSGSAGRTSGGARAGACVGAAVGIAAGSFSSLRNLLRSLLLDLSRYRESLCGPLLAMSLLDFLSFHLKPLLLLDVGFDLLVRSGAGERERDGDWERGILKSSWSKDREID